MAEPGMARGKHAGVFLFKLCAGAMARFQ